MCSAAKVTEKPVEPVAEESNSSEDEDDPLKKITDFAGYSLFPSFTHMIPPLKTEFDFLCIFEITICTNLHLICAV